MELVVGLGEVGCALQLVLRAEGHDPFRGVYCTAPTVKIMHVCFPWSTLFVEHVGAYQHRFKPEVTVIHSTVPVGTSESLKCLHSPVRGVHLNIVKGLRTFEKLLGYDDQAPLVPMVSKSMNYAGIPVRAVHGTRTTEAAKLWETTQYGNFILLEKEIHAWCQANGVNFEEVYTRANKTYNEGYAALEMDHYCRPILKHVPGPIGGHCVVPNAALLDSETAKRILREDQLENLHHGGIRGNR